MQEVRSELLALQQRSALTEELVAMLPALREQVVALQEKEVALQEQVVALQGKVKRLQDEVIILGPLRKVAIDMRVEFFKNAERRLRNKT